MEYGHYSEDGREFIITRPDTPKPWVNCLTNGSYCALVSQTGGGYSFIGGPGYDRITRAGPDIIASDRPGRYVFVRDNSTGEFFSIGWQPVMREPDKFECHHTQGVTTIASSYLGIAGQMVIFVPMDDNMEVWRVTLENERDDPADLSIFTYVEWVLGNYSDDLAQRQSSVRFNQVTFEDNCILATKRMWRRPQSVSSAVVDVRRGSRRHSPEVISANQSWGKYAFIAATVPVDGFDCDREAFVGRYGELSCPRAVKEGKCSNSDSNGRDSVGVIETRFIIPAREKVNFGVLVGIALHAADPSGVVARYSEPGEVESKLDEVKNYWDDYLARLIVSTPDPHFNRSVNIWDKLQSWVFVESPAMPSLYRGGVSVVNFKENCFEVLGVLPMDPEFSKSCLAQILRHQYRDGNVAHRWEVRSNAGVRSGYPDDPLWLVFALTSYLRETGDTEFLNQAISHYYARGGDTVYGHMVRAIEFCLSRLSPRGLFLLGPGDWNESLDQVGHEDGGESVLTTMMLAGALTEAAEVARIMGERSRATAWVTHARNLRGRINRFAWDGSWYIRAITSQGSLIGSSLNRCGSIFLEPQAWSVISKTASNEQGITAMNSVKERLDTPCGPALIQPAYEIPDRTIGTITRFSPGLAQNGGVFTISACWAVMAECMLGRGNRAYEIYRKALGAARTADQEHYEAEPYLYPEYMEGADSGKPGCGRFTWTQGAASWAWRTCIDWICGVKPDYRGLRIDPCVPSGWQEFTVIRPFRDAVYRIAFENPDGVEKRVREITVDGRRVNPHSPIHDFRDRKVHEVRVIMGNAPAAGTKP
ncbi:MAG: hypothetical protein ABFD46_05605 [Armatimonadota bacterium]